MHPGLVEIALGATAAIALIGILGHSAGTLPAAATVEIAAGRIDYLLPGEFLEGGRATSAPERLVLVPSFRMMKQQVGMAEYDKCVADRACAPPEAAHATGDVPVTGVSWIDAVAYARWYSQATGEIWRLPTDIEAAAAAGGRYGGDPYSAVAEDPGNPAVRWLRQYREEAAARRSSDPVPKARGHFGPNEKGLEDFGGNVWEWTSTCYNRASIDPASEAVEYLTRNCGVHVLAGRHRAYISNFVRDGKSGGCAVGTPPDNLGFRLVREGPSLVARALSRVHMALVSLRSRLT